MTRGRYVPATLLGGVMALLATTAAPSASHASPGDLDPAYNGTGQARYSFGTSGDYTAGAVPQADGRIVVAGTTYNGSSADWCVLRYNSDGSPDVSFGSGGRVLIHVGERAECTAVRLQPDGMIVLAGSASTSPTAPPKIRVLRLQTGGALDPNFGVGGIVTTDIGVQDDKATDLRVQTDGRIVVCGNTRSANGLESDWFVARYLTNGQLDASFDGDGRALISFTTHYDQAYALLVMGDGSIVVAGSAEVVTFTDRLALARLTSSGTLDATFDGDGRVVTSLLGRHDVARGVAIQAGTPTIADRLVVTGHAQTAGNQEVIMVARYNLNGTLDTTFDTDGWLTTALGNFAQAYDLTVISTSFLGRKILVTGGAGTNSSRVLTARYNADGTLDTTFDTDGIVQTTIGSGYEYGQAVFMLSGSVVVAGTARPGAEEDYAVLRYTTTGALDTSFDTDGVRLDNVGVARANAGGAALQSDGKLVAGGDLNNFSLIAARYTDAGQLDTSFGGGDGVASLDPGAFVSGRDAAVQADGRVVVAGAMEAVSGRRFAVARFTSAGVPDLSFGTGGTTSISVGNGNTYHAEILSLPDGRVVLGGECEYGPLGSSNVGMALARLRSDGTPDPSFGDQGRVVIPFGTIAEGHAIARQPDGRVLIAGFVLQGVTGTFRMAAVRVDSTGELDATFGSGGYFSAAVGSGSAMANAIALQADGRIVLAGEAIGSDSDFALLRLTPQGTLDPTFDGDGIVVRSLSLPGDDRANAVALQPDGKILAVGSSWNGTKTVYSVARFDSTGQLDLSYGSSGERFVNFAGSYADAARAVALDGQGRTLLAGDTGGLFGVARLTGDEVSAVPPGLGLPPATTLRVAPNPFHSATVVRFHLQNPGLARLRLFNASGALVTTLSDGPREAGWHEVAWDGLDPAGRPRAAGIYFVRLEAAGRAEVQRVVLTR